MKLIADDTRANTIKLALWECRKYRWRRDGCRERGEHGRADDYAYNARIWYREAMRFKLGWTLA